jgi:hypothetical protein
LSPEAAAVGVQIIKPRAEAVVERVATEQELLREKYLTLLH